ncbi:cache domain-containing protein [Undibacterium sp.]|jgi:two-component system NarL family sensor kinase|uniref:cache domain-containing protein n=1 Tax=Undibacterium sp. TaxID=1914977 RepID=UPI002CF35ED6|nr:cache domain-containing protein [Undibacterium sp.]HTD02996.1 cache domain-containing protein [Undibacterium sp.]
MKLRYKIILFAIIPLLLAFLGIALAVLYQTTLLARQQRTTVEQAYMASKEAELKHYVTLGMAAISDLYALDKPGATTMEEAKAILFKLDYGNDGYFYIYDMHGNNLMHPRQPELVGRDLWDLKDPEGNRTIQNLIAKARQGGGVVRYLWEKPSTHKMAPKLGYVVALEKWGWMLGTGIYLDDVDRALNKIDVQVAKNIQSTMVWIAGIAITSALLVALCGLALNISESRVAEAKLKVLAQSVVKSQEDERARLSRDLHDGLSQLLVSIKLQIESGLAKLMSQPAQTDAARTSFARATTQLNGALGELRRISHDLRPAMLDDLGLAAAFEQLAGEFAAASSLPVHFEASGDTAGLSEVGNTVLFRVAQEALTNIHKHAVHVTEVSMLLSGDAQQIRLLISDNGAGFNVADIAGNPKRGIGLSNMKERLETVKGQLDVHSNTSGTQVIASIPSGPDGAGAPI